MRRLALAFLLFSGLVGFTLRIVQWNPDAFSEPALNFNKVVSGQRVGRFFIDGTESRDKLSLRLVFPQCEKPLFLAGYDAYSYLPEQLIAKLYPTAQWHAIYVYRGQVFSRKVEPSLGDILRRKVSFMLLSPLGLSDTILFVFHVPVECRIEESDAIGGANAIIALARTH